MTSFCVYDVILCVFPCRSDVVLICFSVGSQKSLRNCRQIWYPEIRRFCPETPVLLIGCKNDLRYVMGSW